MKDDFYKDINHKRAQDEKSGKTSAGNKKSGERERETLSRSARHKTKDAADSKQPEKKAPKKQQPKDNNFTDKLKGYFSRENAEKGKALFAGKLSSYKQRINKEIKISKEKLGGIGAAKAADKKPEQKKDGGQKRMLPWVLAILVLIPITVLLAFLIFSNFWPSLNDEMKVADENTSEEIADGEETEEEQAFNEELEAQKAEHERRLAENRNEDLTAKNMETNYSQEELQELEEAALSAIRGKEDGSEEENQSALEESEENSETDSEAETASNSTETAGNSTENETEENTETDTDSVSDETENANASHVVTSEDNLYRIAIQYYGEGSAENVQRIMEANGVTPDNLTVGQELIIP
ncbi:LysM peptidoglycan-binding domain-containing protein [Jeotgalicoccus halotolerans]|uniref:LysM domain-containing protein n=1 Tax=Jeotgalicoccus halotolerans TaxID=157227 RepID=A0A3E0B112_9STAP|nr:LysM peptidoglycan-binding domain-containing protein [Jeotgalicoccus halotolerans]REG25633.1 LysM domain-containing protein [Jeotgalicoccus halotolerans]